MKVAVIADENTSLAFRLIGIKEAYVARSKWDAEKAVKAVREMSHIGIVLIGESVADYIKEEIEEWKKSRRGIYPIIMIVPDIKSVEEEREDPLRGMIKRSIGVDILAKR